jgi:hypothetical protein
MVKKMWALFFEKNNCCSCNKDKEALIKDCVIHESQIKSIKQIWVTDKDTFKKIRKYFNDRKSHFGGETGRAEKLLKELSEICLESMKDFDEGAR